MAIIVDPDFLDRNQIIYNTEQQRVSFYPVGAIKGVQTSDGTTGTTLTFTSATFDFTANAVVGDILNVYTGPNAGHYRIDSITDASNVVVEVFDGFTAFSADTGIIFEVREAAGGTAADGATLQSLYSFAKEEWRSDSATFGGDNLIRHEFPFEAITSEQFEIGGGTDKKNWDWFGGPTNADTTINYIRTGGWASINEVNTTLSQYSGIVTLGSLDADAQVYYQQVDVSEPPKDFVLPGPVNQSILVNQDGGPDLRNYLKLFVRKKGRTYAQSEISDIGVSTIQTIVNRFPLANAVDPAIAATDGEIVSQSPWTGSVTRTLTGTSDDGVTVAGSGTFTSAVSTFLADGVRSGDALELTSGTQTGFYHILEVVSETELTVSVADGSFVSESALTFNVLTKTIIQQSTDGVLANVDGDTGTLSSTTGGFTTGVSAGDVVVIDSPSGVAGYYDIISIDSDTQLTLNTEDQVFGGETAVTFDVNKAGMYLQYKWDDLAVTNPGDLTFADANPDTIARNDGGDWVADGVAVGDVIIITNSVNGDNDGSYTVAGVTTATLTLTAADSVVAATNDTSAIVEVRRGFKREINAVITAYKWKLRGNDSGLADIYQFVQHQLRQTSDINQGSLAFRGDVTDLLMQFSTPTATTNEMIIDQISAVDLNNATFSDASGTNRSFPFLAAGEIIFNNNLQLDSAATYWMFFTTNPGGNFSTKDAILVNDGSDTPAPITGNTFGTPSVSFTFDYDGNTQGGRTPATDAAVTVVAIGLNQAQYVVTSGTITRSKANTFNLVAAVERNFSNPA